MPPGIHAGKLYKEARSFTKAARVLGQENPQQMIGPRYYLLCHGLELALKSFLAAHGDGKDILFGIGHDLEKARKRAQKEYGFSASDELINILIRLMSPLHKQHLFRYPKTVWAELPRSNECCDAIDTLLDQIKHTVERANLKAKFELISQGAQYDPEL